MNRLPGSPALRLAVLCVAISAAIAAVLAYRASGILNPLEVRIYSHLLLFQDYYVIAPFIGVLLLALYAPVRQLGLLAAGWCGSHVWVVALATTAALVAGNHGIYHAHTLSLDEHALVFQSRIFAAGRMTGEYPPDLMDWLLPKFLHGRFLLGFADNGAVVSVYWPGFSLLLAPFSFLNAPWLLNPLIGGGTVLVMHRLGMVLFGKAESAGLVVLLTLASPAVTMNALSFYTMPAQLLANAAFMLLLLAPTPVRAFWAGVIGSLALVLHHPVSHSLFALPWILWLAWRPGRLRNLAALFAGYLPLSLVLGLGWSLYLDSMGSRASFAELASTPSATAYAFQYRLELLFKQYPGVGLVSRVLDLAKIWLWAVPGLLVLAAAGAWRCGRGSGFWRPMLLSGLLTYFGYFVVPFDQGHGWGSRYFHGAWLVLPLFAVCFLRDREEPGSTGAASPGFALAGYIAGCALLSLAVLTSLRALQVEQFVSRHLAQRPAATAGEVRVVIVDVSRSYYGWDLVQNDPFLRDRVTTLISHGRPKDEAMMAARFPEYVKLAEDRRGSVWGKK